MKQNSNSKILIVDDNPANIDVLGGIMEEYYEISVATNGQRALDILNSSNKPDLVLLDIMMPEIDGYEVCRKIKANPGTSDIPVLFISAKSEEADEKKGFQLGAVDYLRKPVNSSVALARVKAQLELKHLRDQLAFDLNTTENDRRRQQEFFKQLFENSPQAIIYVNKNNKIIEVNQKFELLFGGQSELESISDLASRIVPDSEIQEHRMFFQSIIEGNTQRIETERIKKDGSKVPVSMFGYPVQVDTDFDGVFIIYEDISQQKSYENQLRHQAFHDALTGIPNRLLLSERLDRALARASRSKNFKFAFLMIDLDRFKSINDSLGHQAGDQLLKTISSRLQGSIRSLDTVARLGGDEFAILIEEYNDTTEVNTIVQRILKNIEKPIRIFETEVHISGSIGVVINMQDYTHSDEIVRDADLAMYKAKSDGKANHRLFDPEMYQYAIESMKLESDLRNAQANNELEMFYQPIVSVGSEIIQGFEALIRWRHPQFGLISPDRFIPIAEETGLIIDLGRWILHESCQQLKTWQNRLAGRTPITMNINISVKQFLQGDLINDLNGLIDEFQLDPDCLKLELTESLFMDHSEFALKIIRELKEIGVHFVIDDFGTGYSSLSYIHRFPVDVLKIDRAFVKNMETEPESLEIVKTIIRMSQSMNMTVVAEGIETKQQLDILKKLSCQNAQGYLFSRPLEKQDAFKLLMKSAHLTNSILPSE